MKVGKGHIDAHGSPISHRVSQIAPTIWDTHPSIILQHLLNLALESDAVVVGPQDDNIAIILGGHLSIPFFAWQSSQASGNSLFINADVALGDCAPVIFARHP